MPKGNYMATKRLSFSAYDIHHLVDSFVYANEPTCYNDVHYFVKKAIDSSKFPCEGFIDTTASHCDMMKKLMIKEMYPGAKYGGYTKDSLGRLLLGDTNSIFYRKPKLIGTPALPYDGLGYDYIARTGYDGVTKLVTGQIDPIWKYTKDMINYYDDTVNVSIPGYDIWGCPTIHTTIHTDTTTMFFRGLINIDPSVSIVKVYARAFIDDFTDSLIVNGVVNTLVGGENFDVKGFQYGLNEVFWAGRSKCWSNGGLGIVVGGEYLCMDCTISGVIIGYDTLEKYPYLDSCITLPDSVIKDGIVYKDLKNLPVQTLIEIFNDEIAEASASHN